MKRVIEVSDTRDGVFLPMGHMLSVLEPEATELQRTILDLGFAFAPEGSDLDVLAIERKVGQSPTGLHLTFRELQRLAADLQQVVDGLFVGCAVADEFPSRADTDSVIVERAGIALAAFDSSFWLVSGPNELLDRLRARFRRVAEVAPSEVKLSA